MYRSFGLWLLILFLASIAAPIIIMVAIFAAGFDQMYANETDRLFTNTLYGISESIATYSDDLGRLSMLPFFNSTIMDSLHDMNVGKYFSDPVSAASINRYYHGSIAQQLSNARKDVLGIMFVPFNPDVDCAFLSQRYAGHLAIIQDFGARDKSWFQYAAEADGRLVFLPVSTEDYYANYASIHFYTGADYNRFSVARLIKDPYTLRPIGVIRVDAIDKVIADMFRHISTGASSSLMLLDQDQNVIYSTNPVPRELVAQIGPDTLWVGGESGRYMVSSYDVAQTPWRLLYLASEKDMREKTGEIYQNVIFWGLISLVGISVLFFLNSRYAVYSEKQILLAMKCTAGGDLSKRLQLRKGSHYAAIAEAFNQTAEKLSEHIDNEYKAILNQRNAEYLALQAQINPHFLYNILSGFITLNRIGEKEMLETLLLKLSNLFRYTCNNKGLSTVGEELQFLGEYLALQESRFSERLSHAIECDEGAQCVLIPRLLLQPLAENAILHGMEPSDAPMLLKVSAQTVYSPKRGRFLLLKVKDNGVGFDMQKQATGRVGLGNVQERLGLFNPRARFHIVSEPGKGCLCVILLPIEEAAAQEGGPA